MDVLRSHVFNDVKSPHSAGAAQVYGRYFQSCQGQSTVKSVINYSGRGDRRGDRNMSLNIALVL